MVTHAAGIRFLKVAVLGVVAANIVFYLLFLAFPPALGFCLTLAGRGPEGSAVEVGRALGRYRAMRNLEKEALRASQIDEPGTNAFQLTKSQMGPFWEPALNGGSAVVAQIAELQAKYRNFDRPAVNRGDIVLDCGANVGTFTRYALNAGARVVVAIEPAPKNAECLRRNFGREIAAGGVIICEKGVWDKEDVLVLKENEETSAMDSFIRSEKTHPGVVVPLTTIDRLVEELKLERVDFIKMDIEGAEQRALRGGRATLARCHPRLEISVNHLPEDPVMIPRIIREAWPGYRPEYLLCELKRDWRVAANIVFFR